MPINQRDVYFIAPTHDLNIGQHPHIVLSTLDANNNEGTFIAVMITSSDHYKDDYSFELQDCMFDKKLSKSDCHVRMHLIIISREQAVIGPLANRMKKNYFDEMMKMIGDLVFNYSFEPF